MSKIITPDQITEEIARYWDDPLGFVRFSYPWGEPGSLLEHEVIDDWQVDVMNVIRDGIRSGEDAIQVAVQSGHGIGKTAEVAWLIDWFVQTRPYPQVVVTANTANQLATKTWRELAKWHGMTLNRAALKWTATKYYVLDHPETWYASAIPWSLERSEAFAGTHEDNVLIIFDEASAIPDIIWEVASGAMTTKGAIWVVFGNPTQNTGRFVDCFEKYSDRWHTREIDSRTARKTNKGILNEWIEDYGIDSDFVRVRVLGKRPRVSSTQFISGELVDAAIERDHRIHTYIGSPIIIGVDVARFGDNKSALCARQGLKAHRFEAYREIDTMDLVSKTIAMYIKYDADIIMCDEVGVGAGVVDRLVQLDYPVIGVNSGNKSSDPKYYNKRAQMWGLTKNWLATGGDLPADPENMFGCTHEELKNELIAPQYGYNAKEQTQLEKKSDMKDRGIDSPDIAESLVHTFAIPFNTRRGSNDDYASEGVGAGGQMDDTTGY